MKIPSLLLVASILCACSSKSSDAVPHPEGESIPSHANVAVTSSSNFRQRPNGISPADRVTFTMYFAVQKTNCYVSIVDASLSLGHGKKAMEKFDKALSDADKRLADGVPKFAMIVSSFSQFPELVTALKAYRSRVNDCGSENIVSHAGSSGELEELQKIQDHRLQQAQDDVQAELDSIPSAGAPNVITDLKVM